MLKRLFVALATALFLVGALATPAQARPTDPEHAGQVPGCSWEYAGWVRYQHCPGGVTHVYKYNITSRTWVYAYTISYWPRTVRR